MDYRISVAANHPPYRKTKSRTEDVQKSIRDKEGNSAGSWTLLARERGGEFALREIPTAGLA
jgi:hypothetical protein